STVLASRRGSERRGVIEIGFADVGVLTMRVISSASSARARSCRQFLQRRTNVWRKITSPGTGAKRPRSGEALPGLLHAKPVEPPDAADRADGRRRRSPPGEFPNRGCALLPVLVSMRR